MPKYLGYKFSSSAETFLSFTIQVDIFYFLTNSILRLIRHYIHARYHFIVLEVCVNAFFPKLDLFQGRGPSLDPFVSPMLLR